METTSTLPTYIRESNITEKFQFSRSTLWRKVRDGTFPKPVKLSARVTAWKVSDVQAWAEKQEAQV